MQNYEVQEDVGDAELWSTSKNVVAYELKPITMVAPSSAWDPGMADWTLTRGMDVLILVFCLFYQGCVIFEHLFLLLSSASVDPTSKVRSSTILV
jgi:hypothetical protein